jgi:GntR family transcriptional regulator, transcriptional repressor for pyruvate dehydrogenase complex
MLELVQRRKTSDILVDQIKQYIQGQELEPGDPLPTEHALAERFGVSRISVREATKTLGFLGILQAKPGRGLTVGRMDVGRLKESLSFYPALHVVPSAELIDSRLIIETGVMPYVARRMARDPEVYQRLNRINDELRQTRAPSRVVEQDAAFHQLLIESSGLMPLAAFNDLLQVFFQRFREAVKKGQWQAAVKDHQRVINALRDGNPTAAAKVLRRHIEGHRKRS